jgi:ATP-dependent DNA helicase UvrD/PcrA
MFDDATPAQREAATYRGGNLLIVAGAGTGKTTTLGLRLAHLIASGVRPERVLLLTFSRRAAAELVSRVERLTGNDVAAAVWAGTFHAVGNRLLRRHGRCLGLDPGFTVLDRSDTADLLALVRDEQGTGGEEAPGRRRAKRQTLADILSRCINAGSPLSDVLRVHFPWCLDERAEIRASFEAYTARKRSRGVLDFDDLLLCWAALLREPDVRAQLGGQFDEILVDEYQDTNAIQADLLEGMCSGGSRLTAVGDDAQAIYSFRAATHRNIMEFPERFAAHVVTLVENHRSGEPILAAANAVIREAAARHPKDLTTRRRSRHRPLLDRCHDEGDQSRRVCARVLSHFEQGMPLRGQAVLVRLAHHSDLLELELTARRIPFVKYGGLRFLEAAHVKDLLCLVRVVANPKDELAWFRILQLMDAVGPATARRITAVLLSEGASPVVLAAGGSAPVPTEARGDADDLALALEEAARLGTEAPGPVLERLRRWLDDRIERRYPDAAARKADLEQLERAAGAARTIQQFLSELTLDPPAATSDLAGPPLLDDDWLTISTIHSAKGCEWDVVHVLHVSDGHIPSDMATGDAEAIEEERRLLYVAVTRARDHLYLYAPLRYHHRPYGLDDAHGYAQLSRFLTPAVLRCFEEAGANPAPELGVPAPVASGGGLAEMDRLTAALWD